MPPDDDLDSTLQASAVDPVAPVVATFASGAGSAVATGPGRTPVPSGASSEGPAGPFRLTTAAGLAAGGMAVAASRAPVGITISREPDPMVAALRATAAATAAAAIHRTGRRGAGAGASAGVAVAAASGGDDEPADAAAAARSQGRRCRGGRRSRRRLGRRGARRRVRRPAPGRRRALRGRDAGPGGRGRGRRRRCGRAQRAYDDLLGSAEAAAATADPRSVRAAKEAAQLAFRDARATGRTRDDVETAARDWLTEINRINIETRDAAATAEKHQRAAADDRPRPRAALGRGRRGTDLGGVRRRGLRRRPRGRRDLPGGGASSRPPAARHRPLEPRRAATRRRATIEPDEDRAAAMGSRAGEDAAIIRILRGDREVMSPGRRDAGRRRRGRAPRAGRACSAGCSRR